MGRLAVILGSNALGPGGEEIAAAAAEHGAAIVQRHGSGEDAYVLPHAIDHAANLRPLVEQGCDRVLAIGSVGSLSSELAVGSLLCPDDFIALHVGLSVFADARAHSAPGFDPRWRGEVIEAWTAGGQAPRDGGVYWQAVGPRFETPAEIRLIARHADVVGMTIASECIVAGELGLDTPRSASSTTSPTGSARAGSTSPRWRTTASPTRPGCATAWRPCCRSWAHGPVTLTVTGARPRRRDGRGALRGRTIVALGPEVAREAGEEIDRGRRRAAGRAAAQRPHPRGDDAVSRQRRRPAVDAMAGGEDLAGRGEARATRTSTGGRASPAPR